MLPVVEGSGYVHKGVQFVGVVILIVGVGHLTVDQWLLGLVLL